MSRQIVPSGRVAGIDVARALAILGMVLINYRLKLGAIEAGPEWAVWSAYRLDGRAAALFVVLAGIGVSIRTRRARVDPANHLASERRSLLTRAALLYAIGLVNLHLWHWDILHFYGVYLALAALLINARAATLWFWTVVSVMGSVALQYRFDYEDHLDQWTVAGAFWEMFFNGLHPVFPWMAFLLVGMWVGRLNLFDAGVRRGLLVAGLGAMALGEGVDLFATHAPQLHGLSEYDAAWFSSWPRPPLPAYMVAATGSSLAVLSLCISASLRFAEHPLTMALVATGQMAFTLYIAHAVAIEVPLQHEVLDDVAMRGALAYGLVFYGAAMMFSVWWRRRYPSGPLEGLIKQLATPDAATWSGALAEPARVSVPERV